MMKTNVTLNPYAVPLKAEENPFVVLSETDAVQQMLPPVRKRGMILGCGTKLYEALNTKTIGTEIINIDSPETLRKRTETKPEAGTPCGCDLAVTDTDLDFVIFSYSPDYSHSLHAVSLDVYHRLRKQGVLIVCLIDNKSPHGHQFSLQKLTDDPYSISEVDRILFELSDAGFKHFNFNQTLFSPPDKVTEVQPPKAGYGEGAFVVVQARKSV